MIFMDADGVSDRDLNSSYCYDLSSTKLLQLYNINVLISPSEFNTEFPGHSFSDLVIPCSQRGSEWSNTQKTDYDSNGRQCSGTKSTYQFTS